MTVRFGIDLKDDLEGNLMEEWLISGSIGAGVMIYMVCKKCCVHVPQNQLGIWIQIEPLTIIEISYISWYRSSMKLMRMGDENARDGNLINKP